MGIEICIDCGRRLSWQEADRNPVDPENLDLGSLCNECEEDREIARLDMQYATMPTYNIEHATCFGD